MIPKKVTDHLEEYISQEIYVQIAVIKGKEKVSTELAVNKYFSSNHFRDLAEGRPYDHFIEGLRDKCLGKLKNSPMRNTPTDDPIIIELQNKLNKLSDEELDNTYDDVLTVLKEEAEEDVLRLAGVGDEEITDGILTKTKRRFNWLLLNLFTAFLATYCISLFGATIKQMVVLAFLMPIVASMGGNAGMQTLAVTVRSLATKDLTKNNFSKNVFKEFNIGILNGVIFAIISSLIVQVWFNDHVLSLIISISMIVTMIVAGLFGILIPVTLKKLNIDPAISSSVFVTTITDVIGFVSFLGVAAYFL